MFPLFKKRLAYYAVLQLKLFADLLAEKQQIEIHCITRVFFVALRNI